MRHTLRAQGKALLNLAETLDLSQFHRALTLIANCQGHVIVSGMGKSGHVGKKISATLASTGTPSFFVHPAEAFHGDLGMITSCDLVLLISASGETDEVLKLVPSLHRFGHRIIAITNQGASTLARHAEAVLELHMTEECCPNNLAPTTSTTLTMATGDALAVALMQARRFQPDDFARYHPGGTLGRRLLTRVTDVMDPEVPQITSEAGFREVIHAMTSGRQGMVMVNDASGRLAGIITDGDLRRFMEKNADFTDGRAAHMMTRDPLTLPETTMMVEAEETMRKHRISALLIVDGRGAVSGIVRIYDSLSAPPAALNGTND